MWVKVETGGLTNCAVSLPEKFQSRYPGHCGSRDAKNAATAARIVSRSTVRHLARSGKGSCVCRPLTLIDHQWLHLSGAFVIVLHVRAKRAPRGADRDLQRAGKDSDRRARSSVGRRRHACGALPRAAGVSRCQRGRSSPSARSRAARSTRARKSDTWHGCRPARRERLGGRAGKPGAGHREARRRQRISDSETCPTGHGANGCCVDPVGKKGRVGDAPFSLVSEKSTHCALAEGGAAHQGRRGSASYPMSTPVFSWSFRLHASVQG